MLPILKKRKSSSRFGRALSLFLCLFIYFIRFKHFQHSMGPTQLKEISMRCRAMIRTQTQLTAVRTTIRLLSKQYILGSAGTGTVHEVLKYFR
jgi:hypothetical protein